MATASSSYPKIYAVVSRIPKGRVATYGQVAVLAGLPRQARLVGYAMHALPADSDVPWHRVVNAAGRISIRSDGLGHDELQAQLLAREGVRFVGRRPSPPSRAATRLAKRADSSASRQPGVRRRGYFGCGTMRMYGRGAFQPSG